MNYFQPLLFYIHLLQMKIPAIPGFDPLAFEKYLKNTGWLMLARVGSLVIKILINNFALAAYLGASGFGMYSYPMVVVTFFVAISALGLDGFITRELLNNPEKKNVLLGSAFRLRFTAGLVTLPLLYLTYHLITTIEPVETPFYYLLIVGFTSIIQSVNIIDSFFQSQIQGKNVMYVQVFGNVVSALVKLLFILLKLPLLFFIISYVIDALLLAGGYVIMYRRKGNTLSAWKYEASTALYLVRNSWPLAFSAILVTIYMKIDQLMIESFLGTGQLGIYSTVVSLSESWYFIPVAIVTSVFPAIMNARKTDLNRYNKRLQDLYDLMVAISLAIAIVMTFASGLIYRIAYTDEYLSGAPVLAVHVWAGLFVFLGTASSQYLIAEGLTKLSMVRTAVGALVNILLNLLWIPRFGIIGAAYATLVAYAISTFFIIFIPRTHKQGLIMLKSLFLISLLKKITKK